MIPRVLDRDGVGRVEVEVEISSGSSQTTGFLPQRSVFERLGGVRLPAPCELEGLEELASGSLGGSVFFLEKKPLNLPPTLIVSVACESISPAIQL